VQSIKKLVPMSSQYYDVAQIDHEKSNLFEMAVDFNSMFDDIFETELMNQSNSFGDFTGNDVRALDVPLSEQKFEESILDVSEPLFPNLDMPFHQSQINTISLDALHSFGTFTWDGSTLPTFQNPSCPPDQTMLLHSESSAPYGCTVFLLPI
jgi:hypothetical protein